MASAPTLVPRWTPQRPDRLTAFGAFPFGGGAL